jgi:Spy/CpxP family protein refolding chaperone
MKLPLIAILAAVMAAPVVSIPVPADAQVLTGGGRARPARRARPAPPPLSEAEEDRLWDAQDEIRNIDDQIADLQVLVETQGALTPEQQAQIDAHAARRAALQADVTRLEAKRDR